jgi:hypothetical protein
MLTIKNEGLMKRSRAAALASALLLAAALTREAPAAALPMTPMTPGFHQHLQCNGGYVLTQVTAADPKIEPNAELITTTIAVGPQLTKTKTVRSVDGQGNIYGIGYVIDAGVFKRFPRQLLLPAKPAPGEHSGYSNITGATIDKRFDGTKTTTDAAGHALTGFAFSDYLGGQKLNTVVYVPGFGIAEARFLSLQGPKNDLICHVART